MWLHVCHCSSMFFVFFFFFFFFTSKGEQPEGPSYWCVNVHQFHHHFRDQAIIAAVAKIIDQVCLALHVPFFNFASEGKVSHCS